MSAASRDRAFRRLVLKANREHGGGDRCHGCGRALRSLEVTLTGEDRRGALLIVAQCCARRLAIVLGYGIYIANGEDPDNIADAARIAHLAFAEPAGAA